MNQRPGAGGWKLELMQLTVSGLRPVALHDRVFSGGQSEVDPPVPIPNTEVKRLSADDTGGAILCGK